MSNSTRSTEEQAAKEIMSSINAMHLDTFAIGQKLARDHRTLQQSFMNVVIGFIDAMANNGTDARNEASVEFARKVVNATFPVFKDETVHPRMPFI